MKLIRLFFLAMVAISISFVACKKEDDKATCSDGVQNQGETGIDCGGPCAACKEGIHGTWKSFPVAPLLLNFADSIIARFETNNTYVVDQWKNGSKTTLTGTFVQNKPTSGDIWSILVNQTSPTVLTSEGIFQVYDNDTKMRYEIVQTTPDIGAGKPTPAGGFGSSTFNGAPLGALNIQEYVRVK